MATSSELDYSGSPGLNTDIGGVSIAEGIPPSNLNDAIRAMAAFRHDASTRIVGKSAGTYTAVKADHNQFWYCFAAATINLTAAATLGNGWSLLVKATSGAVVIDPAGSQLIDGAATLLLAIGSSVQIICTGTTFYSVSASAGTAAVTLTGTQTLTNKTLTSPTINGATLTSPTINGATLTSPIVIGDVSFDGGIACSGSLTASSTLEALGTATFDSEVRFGSRYSSAAGSVGLTYFGVSGLANLAIAANGTAPLVLNRSDANTTNLACLVVFRNGGVGLNAILATPTVVQFNTASDHRMKENVVEMTGALERLAALRPINFTWIDDPGAGVADGFIAHEVQAIVPTAVNGEKDGTEMQGVDLSKLVPLLVGASKELLATVNDLTARIAELEAKAA